MAETRFTRRDLIRASAVGGAATLIGKGASAQVLCGSCATEITPGAKTG